MRIDLFYFIFSLDILIVMTCLQLHLTYIDHIPNNIANYIALIKGCFWDVLITY